MNSIFNLRQWNISSYQTIITMNSIAAIFFFAAVAAASASVIAPSGIIARSYVAPAWSGYSASPYAYGAYPYVAPYVAPYAAPGVSAYSTYDALPYSVGYQGVAAENTVVAGPSGTISSSKSVAAPAYTAGYAARYAGYPAAYSGLYW